MLWLYLTLFAYFLNAIVFIIDKYLLHTHIQKPFSYAFGVAILSLGALLLIPFGVFWHGWQYFGISIACGAMFFVALIFLYTSVRMSDVTTASTQVGTISVIFTYIFSILLLGQVLSFSNNIAFGFLLLGVFMLSRLHAKMTGHAVIAGIIFGLYFVLIKLLFNTSGYIDGLFWTRMGFVGAAILSLITPEARKEVYNTFKSSTHGSKVLFALNKVISGVGFLVLYWAIKLGNVSIVNSLLGFQFLLTFIVALIFRNKISSLADKWDRRTVIEKLAGITSIILGFIFLRFR